MTVPPVERNYRPDIRAERARQSAYHDTAKNAEMYLTMRYGGDWWDKLTQETATAAGGTAVTTPAVPQLTARQREMLQEEAQARFAKIEGDQTALDDAYDVFKGTVRTGLSALDAEVGLVINPITKLAANVYKFVNNPSQHTYGDVTGMLLPERWVQESFKSASNTTLWTQINAALDGGFNAGFGADATGSGFTVSYESPIGREKAQRAYDYASLPNGDAASLGRLAASAVGFGKGTSPYSILSGAVDGLALLTLDPLNFVTGGGGAAIKGVKIAEALKAAGIAEHELPLVMEAIRVAGKNLDDVDSAALIDEVLRAKARSRVIQEHPDLAGLRGKWTDKEMHNAARAAARDSNFAVDNRGLLDDYRRLQDTVDRVVKNSNAATDEAVHAELRAPSSAGKETELGDAAAPPPERLDVDPEEAQRAARNAYDAAALEDDAVNAYFDATQQVMDAYRAAGVDLSSVNFEDFLTAVKAYNGLSDKGANIAQAMHNMVGGDFDNLATLISRMDNPADLYDMFPLWGTDTLRDLSKISDPHQALVVMFNGVLKGDITRAGNRVARWSVMHGQSGAAGASFARRVTRLSRDGVPNSHMASLEDADSMVKLTSDFITEGASMAYRKSKNLLGWESFRRDWIGKMIDATDAVSRKRVWIEMQNEFLHHIPGWDALPKDVQNKWKGEMQWFFDRNGSQEARVADIRARMETGINSQIMGLADDPSTFNEDFVGLIHAAADLSENVSMMDTTALRKLFNLVQESGELSSKGKAVDVATMVNDYFDLYLRPLYLAFRPAYALLQIGDSGGRSLAMGFTNVFSSPLQSMAIAAHLTYSGDSRIIKVLNKIIKTAPTNPDGTRMFGEAQVSALQGVLDAVNDSVIGQYLMRHQFRDFATGSNIGDQHLIDLGWEWLRPGDDNFQAGWAQTLLFHMTPSKWGDDMFQDVFDVMLDGDVPARIRDWGNANGLNLSKQDLVTEFYFSGPGKESFHRLIASAQTKKQHIPLLRQVATDRSKLHSFLWDGSEAASVFNRVHDLTGQFDPRVMRTIREVAQAKAEWANYLHTIPPRKAEKAFKGKGADFIRPITLPDGKVINVNVAKTGSLENVLRSVVNRLPEDQQPLRVRHRAHASDPNTAPVKEWYQQMLSSFFTHAGDVEKRLGQAPMLRDEVLLESAKRVGLLNTADAQIMHDRIMAQLPKFKRTSKQREIVSLLKAGMNSTGERGAYTLKELTDAAQNSAFRKLSDSMYGVRGRNAGAQRFAIMLPFIQSWVNAARVYLKQAALNPKRAANALRMLRVAETSESGSLYDVMPGVNRDDDPSKPLFWTDDLGKRMVSIPFLGYAVHAVDSALAGVLGSESNPNFQPYVNLRVDRWNPLNFGEPLPGVGPGVTLPASVIDNHVTPIPEELRKWWFAMETGDVTQDKNVLEANMPWFVKEVIPSEEDIAAQKGNAIAALIANHPERYLNEDGYVTDDKLPSLVRDSEELALAMFRGNLWRAAVMRGGTSIPKTVTNTKGEAVPLATLSAAFDAEVERTGSVGAGYAFLVDQYGPQGLSYLIGSRESTPIANDEGYAFARDNKDLFDKTYDVLGYFFPSSDMSGDPVMRLRSKQYQRLLTESGENRQVSVKEYASAFNQKIKAVRDLRLEDKFVKGELTKEQYEAEKAANGQDFQIATSEGFDTSHREDIHRQLREALNNPTLAGTPTGQALSAYLTQYDLVKGQAEGGSLTGDGDAALRAYLRGQGEKLTQAYPEFIPLWRGQLMWEVDK